MAGFLDGLDRLKDARAAHRELARVQEDNEKLRLQNERLRAAMRRCLTCEYRIDALRSQEADDDAAAAASAMPGMSDQ